MIEFKFIQLVNLWWLLSLQYHMLTYVHTCSSKQLKKRNLILQSKKNWDIDGYERIHTPGINSVAKYPRTMLGERD